MLIVSEKYNAPITTEWKKSMQTRTFMLILYDPEKGNIRGNQELFVIVTKQTKNQSSMSIEYRPIPYRE